MDNIINLSWLNDFIFCPVSIYFHNLYSDMDDILYQSREQIEGKNAHTTVDNEAVHNSSIITNLPVYNEELNIMGIIDWYNKDTLELRERKRHITKLYDGQIMQLYGEYFCMTSMGYRVEKLSILSLNDNRIYNIPLPTDNKNMESKFLELIKEIASFNMESFNQNNKNKCIKCIYEPICDRGCH